MTKEEALGKGIIWHETVHSMKRRSPWHDYCRKGTYMLTLVVNGRKPLLGELATVTDASASDVKARVELSALGKAIRDVEVNKINHFYPMVDVWKLCIMPDHIHMIVRVKEDMDISKHLGLIVAGFKGGCSRAARRLGVTVPPASAGEEVQGECLGNGDTEEEKAPLVPLFEQGYNDKILLRDEQLDNWKHYLDDNPRRLMMKRRNPQLFMVLHEVDIAGKHCQMVGNRFLLDVPDKMAVIVHRRYTDEDNERLREAWLACGERGGVLVSAAISSKEKEVLREAMNRGYRIIHLRENGFPELYKPSGEAFDACVDGRLLQISPWLYHMERKIITRAQCLELNAMAEEIAGR